MLENNKGKEIGEVVVVYRGFHTIELITALIKGKLVKRERLAIQDSVGALVIDASGKVGLVLQHRPTVGKKLWEIPAGIMDKSGLTHIETILEELEEECEIKKEQLITVNETPIEEYYMMAGSSPAKMRIFEIHVASQTDKVVEDADVEEVRWFTRDEIITLLRNGGIEDSKSKLAIQHHLYRDVLL